VTPVPRHLPPRRRIPPSRRATMRQVLEAAVAHDHRGRRWSWRGAVLFVSSGLVLAGGGAAAYALSRPPAHPGADGGSAGTAAARSKAAAKAAAVAQANAQAAAAQAAAAAAAKDSGTTGAIPPVCAASQLAFTVGPSTTAMGRVSYPVVVHNASAAACNLYGYPGMQMLMATGGALQTQVVRNATMFGLPPEQMVVLTPGEEAFFALSFSDGTGYGTLSCPASAQVEITPPNAYTPAVITWQIAPYPSGGGACGAVQVSYVVAGTPNHFM
jgi:Protein of unknown function (DUF4232)